jgi:hypothetical protein
MTMLPNEFVFRASDRIGYAAAEEDHAFLVDCFVDNGQYEEVSDGNDMPSHLLLGRTGAGKTALIEHLSERKANVIRLDPEKLAVDYLTNSLIMRFLVEMDVDLDLFFQLLWRHVIAVEVIRKRYRIIDQGSMDRVLATLTTLFRAPQQQRALKYLEHWGDRFWEEVHSRVIEVATKVEADIRSQLGAKSQVILAKIEAGQKLTDQEKREVRDLNLNPVPTAQLRELSDIIDLVGAILSDPQNVYYVVIDHLDDRWVDAVYKGRVIRALLESIKKFLKVRHLRVVVALRYDLLDRVLAATRDSEQQEEKLESIYLEIRWSKEQLAQVLDRRINRLVKQRYTKKPVSHSDVLPPTMPGGDRRKPTMEWLLERTFMRPRDVIVFFNLAIKKAVDTPYITEALLLETEGEYSRDRLNSIADEYVADYPTLLRFVDVLYKRPSKFLISEVSDMDLLESVANALGSPPKIQDALFMDASKYAEGTLEFKEFRKTLFSIFYETGIVGLRKAHGERVSWTYQGRRSLSRSEIVETTKVYLHPMLWRRFGVEVPSTTEAKS